MNRSKHLLSFVCLNFLSFVCLNFFLVSLQFSKKSPNLLHVFQIVETDLWCFIALEIAENGDLTEYINSRSYLPEPEARFLFKQMCGAISYCHSQDIVHRDLKCDNVMLSRTMDEIIGGKSISEDKLNSRRITIG